MNLKYLSKILCLLLTILIITNCSDNKSFYPDIITKNRLEKEYNIAKWLIYSSNYHNDTIACELIEKDSSFVYSNLNIVSCALNLFDLTIKEDTIEMNFSFFLKDSTEICNILEGCEINRIVFIKGDSLAYRLNCGFSYNSEVLEFQRKLELGIIDYNKHECFGCYPMEIEKIRFKEFLQKTKHKLNPWLKKEAIKRGVLKD